MKRLLLALAALLLLGFVALASPLTKQTWRLVISALIVCAVAFIIFAALGLGR